MRRVTFPLYVGGFLGPFGGAMLVALIPNVAAGLDASIAQVAAAITAYMVPFAVLQLVSGTLAERLGPRRVVRAGYVAFGLAALACAFAPEIWSFLAARAAMGAANAFLSPILLAALSEVARPGCSAAPSGTFAAAQTAGLMLAPVLGGLLGEISWRLAFVLVAVVSGVLAVPKQTLGTMQRQARASGRASLRVLLNRWIALLATQAALGYLGFTAIGFVLVLVGAEEFGLGLGRTRHPHRRLRRRRDPARPLRRQVVDRAGRPATALAGAIACTVGVLGLIVAPSAWSLGLVYFGIGCASTFVWAGLNTIAVESFPENRAGATSAYSAFKFAGRGDRAPDLRAALQRRLSPPVPARRRVLRAPGRARSCPGSRATDETPRRRARARPGRLLPGHDAPTRRGARGQPAGCGTPGRARSRRSSRARRRRCERLVAFAHRGPSTRPGGARRGLRGGRGGPAGFGPSPAP